MTIFIVAVAAFIGVAALVGGVALVFRDKPGSEVENRLDVLTGVASPQSEMSGSQETSLLSRPLESQSGVIERIYERFGDIDKLFEQADTSLTIPRLTLIVIAFAMVGTALGAILGIHFALLPALGGFMGILPFVWLFMRRRKRLKEFAVQLPDALEMIARALRAGQSLAFGFSSVSSEMPAPIGKEFGRVFEEQNLGIPLDDTLRTLTDRVPNMDLKFFVTAVILQRQTGGDLAEILDKIGGLIRERFQIWGQIQALTGEGRLSGTVLLSLPIVLFFVSYQLNPGYVLVLFEDPMGQKMLAAAVVLQIIGALVIKKIVNIKV